jgi:cytochrome P450
MSNAGAIPTAPGRVPAIGHAVGIVRDPFGFLAKLPRHGDLVRVQVGPYKMLVVCDPDLTHHVLVNDRVFDKGGFLFDRARDVVGNGLITCAYEDHRRQRRLAQPAFHPTRLVAYSSVMTEQIEAVLDTWRDGQIIDARIEMQKITMAIMLSTMFGTTMNASMAAEVMDDLTHVVSGIYLRMFLPRPLINIPLPMNRTFERANTRLRSAVTSVIATRIGETNPDDEHNDLLGMLLAATDQDTDGTGFSEAELADQIVTFFSAGVETTANTLAWALCLISSNPRIEDRLQREVDDALGGRPPAYEDLPNLPLTRNIVTETLRLQPAIWFMTRQVTEDTTLAGHDIPAGTTVVYSPYIIQHRADLYPDPETFNPDRWNEPTPRTPRHRNSFIPFGGGARKCIGDQVGTTEAVLALAAIAARWEVGSISRTPPAPQPGATNRPKKTRMRLSARKHERVPDTTELSR